MTANFVVTLNYSRYGEACNAIISAMAKIGPKEAQRRALREIRDKDFQDIDANQRWLASEMQAAIATVVRRGRPPLNLTPEQRAERRRQQTLKRVQKHRAKRKK